MQIITPWAGLEGRKESGSVTGSRLFLTHLAIPPGDPEPGVPSKTYKKRMTLRQPPLSAKEDKMWSGQAR
ncbi:unnamed protein product [Nezara viridula]|uniref:Uncharacterized protein n=1 Tax=Nezara viridula TaxID=85310 RepID=A0A9P0HFD0_NEZVI|nr:unnamed protein product [Nezara viridula]